MANGAYLSSPLGLFRLHAIRPGTGGVSEVVLTDESVPLVTARNEHGTIVVIEPVPLILPLHMVLEDFDLVERGPNMASVASEEEWGKAG